MREFFENFHPKRLTNFRKLLPGLCGRKLFRPLGWLPLIVGGGLALIAILIALLPLATLLKVLLVNAGIIVGGALLFSSVHNAMKPVTDEEHMVVESVTAAQKFLQLVNSGKLHRHLDPVAGELLERAAYEKCRIDAILSGPEWQNVNSSSSLAKIKEQALRSSEIALREMIVICASCIGEPTRTPGSDVQNILNDVMELDLAEALRGFKEFGKGDWTKWSYQSPNRGMIVEPSSRILQRLQALAEGLEKRTADMMERKTSESESPTVQSIDLILAELSHMEQAEVELDQQLHE